MLRKLAGLLVVPLVALGALAATPGTASAAPTALAGSCTMTGDLEIPKIIIDQYGNHHITGWIKWSYVGSFSWILGTYRYFHVSSKGASGSYGYKEAYAVRCVDGEIASTIDLTREVEETITSPTDLICTTSTFTVGTTTYVYIGSRLESGDKFRYWRKNSTAGMLLSSSAYSARCA